VVFPDQCTSFQYSRNFLQEVTRLRLHEEWEFGINEGILEQNVHFAPSMEGIRRLAKMQGNSSVRALLAWEVYSGILPKFETIHEVNYAAGKNERNKGLKGTGKGADKTTVKGDAVDYTQRVANFNFLKYRFAARSADVTTRFDPFLVCGYPAVVIDKPFILDPEADAKRIKTAYDKYQASLVEEQKKGNTSALDDMSEQIRYVARELGAPTQYLGMIAGINHNIDQQGGNSSFTLTHARSHRVTEDDFLDILSKELTTQVETEYKVTIIHAEEALKKGDWKQIKMLRDVTDQYLMLKLPALLSEEAVAEVQSLLSGTEKSPPVEEREEATDFLDTIESMGQFAALLNMPPPSKDLTLVSDTPAPDSPSNRVSLRGKLKKVKATHSQASFMTPYYPGKLRKGGKGPCGGSILQVQCFNDQAVVVKGDEVNAKVGPVVWSTDVIVDGDVAKPWCWWDGSKWVYTPPPLMEVKPIHAKQWHSKDRVKESDVFIMWRSVAIYEEVPVPHAKRLSKLLPVEEALRPPWFSPLYSNWSAQSVRERSALGEINKQRCSTSSRVRATTPSRYSPS
jgi:hypothetical protein